MRLTPPQPSRATLPAKGNPRRSQRQAEAVGIGIVARVHRPSLVPGHGDGCSRNGTVPPGLPAYPGKENLLLIGDGTLSPAICSSRAGSSSFRREGLQILQGIAPLPPLQRKQAGGG